jgi:cytochrome c oxidase assembly protein subunit 15
MVSPVRLSTITRISLAGLLLIVPSGALVRLTDSGLGCPDWPGCHGEVVPPLSGHAWIEYSNRVLSAIVVALAVGTWLAARVARAPRRLRRWAAVPAVAGVAQGPLGALTVLSDLHPLLVSSHFALSIVALGAGVVVVLLARDNARGLERRPVRGNAALAGLALFVLCGVIVTGVLVTAAGPHSGDPEVIRRLGNLSDAAAVHVRMVIGFVVMALAVGAFLIRRRPSDPATRTLAVAFVPFLGLQIGLGEYQWRHQLPWEVILGHVTVAGVVWSLGVATAWLLAQPLTAPLPVASQVIEVPGEARASRHAAST